MKQPDINKLLREARINNVIYELNKLSDEERLEVFEKIYAKYPEILEALKKRREVKK